MKIFNSIEEIKKYLRGEQRNHTIGFIPTMGALHEGHLSMVKRASKENDIVVVSIFVNPTQFGEAEDFEKYPKTFERDIELAGQSGAQVIFYPDAKEIYPKGYKTYVEVEEISDVLCGASRQGHFKGVATVVTKLLNIVHPDKAYFGQKDAQQAIIIKQLVKDLNMDSEIVISPTVREKNGLAISSRNVYLSEIQKKESMILSEALLEAKRLIGYNYNIEQIKNIITNKIAKTSGEIEYVEIVDAETLENIDSVQGNILIAVAVRFGETRLIDNVIIDISENLVS